jgi:hypothetical protein
MLDTIARSVPPDAPPAIGADLIEHLEVTGHELDGLVKEARRRQPRSGLAGRLRGGRAGEGKAPDPGESGSGTAQPAPGTGTSVATPGHPNGRA